MRELYELTWPGKHDAVIEAGRPTDKTLRPSVELSKDFDTTQNLYIEGDNLEALKLLQKSYMKRVKLIYIDPPYNTGHDFIYHDDFSYSDSESQQEFLFTDESGARNFTLSNYIENSKSNPRFHSDWLNMMYPRLKLARNLLSDDGVIFISIDDNEQANLRKICDEIFGENNFIAQLIWKSKSGGASDSRFFAVDHEYILCYASNVNSFTLNQDTEADVTTSYNRRDDKGEYALERLDKQSLGYLPSLDFEIIGTDGKSYFPHQKDPAHPNARWRWSRDTVAQRYNELVFENGNVYTKNYKKEGVIPRSLMIEERFGRTRTGKTDFYALFNSDCFSSPKPYKLIRHLIKLAANDDSIILDFFAGSSTTAHAVMALNAQDGGSRKFIMIQIPEQCSDSSEAFKAGYKTICEIGRGRILRAGENFSGDTGFRVLKVDSGNYRDVYFTPENLTQDMLEDLIENIKPERSGLDLLFSTIIELGLSLSLKYSCERVNDFLIHYYGDDDKNIIACFDENINASLVEYIARKKPSCALFRDSCFENSNILINLEQIYRHNAPDSEQKRL